MSFSETDVETPNAKRPVTAVLAQTRDVALVLFAVYAAAVHFATFRDYVFEDAYITYRYADNLAHGRGFVFNPGERVFGTSTPFYALLLAFLGRLGVDIPVAGSLLYALGLSLTALGGAWILRRAGHGNLAVVYALIVLWGAGLSFKFFGMETTLYSCLLLATLIAAMAGKPVLTGLALGLAFLTRYDAFVLTAALFVVLWIRDRKIPWRTYLTAGTVVAPWLLFSWLYFGSVFPNTLAAKAQRLSTLDYMTGSLVRLVDAFFSPASRFASTRDPSPGVEAAILAALLFPCLFLTLRLVRRQALSALLLVFPVLLWLGYSLIGPPLPHRWYLVPGMYFLVLYCLLAWGCLFAGRRFGPWPTAAALALLAAGWLALAAGVKAEWELSTDNVVYHRRVDSYTLLARWINDNGLNDLTLLASEPGYLTYQTKNPVIDAVGLVTKNLPVRGSGGDRLKELTEIYRPDLLVTSAAKFRRDGGGYTPLYQTLTRTLYIRDEVLRRRARVLARRRLTAESVPAGALRHPISIDFEDPAAGWLASDSRSRRVSRPHRLVYAGESVTDAYLHTSGPKGYNVILSPPLHIDFDALSFRFSAPARTTAVELMVDGLVVLRTAGHRRLEGEMVDVVWPVHSWRGKTAVLRLVDDFPPGFVALDRLESSRHRRRLVFDDFESGTYGERWAKDFGREPCGFAELARDFGLHTVLGRATAGSLCRKGRRELVSRPFRVEHERLAFVVLDFADDKSRVELRAGGEVVQRFSGGLSRRPVGVVWDVSALRGGEAVLAVVDEDPAVWLGIGIDDIVLFDR